MFAGLPQFDPFNLKILSDRQLVAAIIMVPQWIRARIHTTSLEDSKNIFSPVFSRHLQIRLDHLIDRLQKQAAISNSLTDFAKQLDEQDNLDALYSPINFAAAIEELFPLEPWEESLASELEPWEGPIGPLEPLYFSVSFIAYHFAEPGSELQAVAIFLMDKLVGAFISIARLAKEFAVQAFTEETGIEVPNYQAFTEETGIEVPNVELEYQLFHSESGFKSHVFTEIREVFLWMVLYIAAAKSLDAEHLRALIKTLTDRSKFLKLVVKLKVAGTDWVAEQLPVEAIQEAYHEVQTLMLNAI